jgi:hypothetical protein
VAFQATGKQGVTVPAVHFVTARLSSGVSANILDFAHSAKAETGLKGWVSEGHHQRRRSRARFA